MNINTSSSNNFSVDAPDAHVLPSQPVLMASSDSNNSTESAVLKMQAAEKEFDAYASQYEAALNEGLSVSGEAPEYFARKRVEWTAQVLDCLLYTSPSPRDATLSRMPSSA